MELKQNGVIQLVRHYLGACYEKDLGIGGNKEKLYLGGDAYSAPAVYVKQGSGSWQLYFICRDYLGSITQLADSNGSLTQELSFDPWGNLRNPADWSFNNMPTDYLFDRGFTGHEHLDNFSLVNMNGRVYDPLLGRMLSPDKYIQAPDYTQNLNRYSYCFNNPLKYTDPTGNFGEGVLPWAYMLFGNYAINVADNVINKGMPFGKALRASTVSASVNYSPSMNYFSNYQVDAYTSAAHLVDYSRDLDQQIAS